VTTSANPFGRQEQRDHAGIGRAGGGRQLPERERRQCERQRQKRPSEAGRSAVAAAAEVEAVDSGGWTRARHVSSRGSIDLALTCGSSGTLGHDLGSYDGKADGDRRGVPALTLRGRTIFRRSWAKRLADRVMGDVAAAGWRTAGALRSGA